MTKLLSTSEVEHYIKGCNRILEDDIDIEIIKNIRNAIKGDKVLMSLYGEKNPHKILLGYNSKVAEVSKALGDSDESIYILNILEYIRFTCMGEDFISIPGVLYFDSLNSYQYSSALIGKGNSYSQCKFFEDLIGKKIGEISEMRELDPINLTYEIDRYNVIQTTQGYIDPSHYDEKTTNPTYTYSSCRTEPFNYNLKEKEASTKRVAKYLIEKLGIDKISKLIIPEDASDAVKNESILAFISNGINKYNTPVRHYSINIGETLLEASKALELFYIANDIKYERIQSPTKENTTFNALLDGTEVKVDIKNVLDKKMLSEKIYQKS